VVAINATGVAAVCQRRWRQLKGKGEGSDENIHEASGDAKSLLRDV